jgi:hypothetical protein
MKIIKIEKKILAIGWLVAKGILASLTSITTSISFNCSFSSFSVLAI